MELKPPGVRDVKRYTKFLSSTNSLFLLLIVAKPCSPCRNIYIFSFYKIIDNLKDSPLLSAKVVASFNWLDCLFSTSYMMSSILTEVPRSLSRFLMTPLFTELEYCKKKLLRAKRGFSFKFFFLHFYIIKYIFYITVLCPKSCLLLREIRRLRSGFLSLQSQPSMPIGKWHLQSSNIYAINDLNPFHMI